MVSKQERSARSAVDDLGDAIEAGDEARAMEAARRMPEAGATQVDEDAYDLTMSAMGAGMPAVALWLVKHERSGGLDFESLLERVAEDNQEESFAALAPGATWGTLMRCAYYSKRGARDEGEPESAAPVAKMALALATGLREKHWEHALSRLEARWMARPRGAYEEACEKWSVPIW